MKMFWNHQTPFLRCLPLIEAIADVSISYLLVNYGGSIEHQRQLPVQLNHGVCALITIFKNPMFKFRHETMVSCILSIKYTRSLLRGHTPRRPRVNWHLHSHKSIPTPIRSAKSFLYQHTTALLSVFAVLQPWVPEGRVLLLKLRVSWRIDSADQKGAKIVNVRSESSVTSAIFRLQEFITIEEGNGHQMYIKVTSTMTFHQYNRQSDQDPPERL